MGNRKFVPQVGKHFACCFLLSVDSYYYNMDIYTISHSDGYSSLYERSSSLSGLEAFGFVIYSLEGIISSFVLKGFSYVVEASIHYLDEKGEFDEK